jgi:hypothetical protein
MRKDSLEGFQATSQLDFFCIQTHVHLVLRGKQVLMCGLAEGRGVALEINN